MMMAFAPVSRAAVVINEFLANNGGSFRGEDLESPSWIEIYNSGPGVVNLGGWHLTDDALNPTKWAFPATNLPAVVLDKPQGVARRFYRAVTPAQL